MNWHNDGLIQEGVAQRTDDMTGGEGVTATLVQRLRDGFPVVYPTVNLPALGCIPTVEALDRLFELKQRPPEMKVSLAVASLQQASGIVEVDESAVALLSDFPSGALSLLLPAISPMDERVGGENIAIRVVENEPSRTLLQRVGPLTATSANPSGVPPESDCQAAAAALGLPEAGYLAGVCSGDPPSTLIGCEDYGSLTSGEQLQVLREGMVSEEEVKSWLRKRT